MRRSAGGARRGRLSWVSVVGARPQFVKAAMLERAVAASSVARRRVRLVLVHTGQHYDRRMSGVFFRELGLSHPSENLSVGSGTHAEQTAKMLVGLERVLQQERPALVITYGDTNSTLAATLAAAKLGTPVAHVEAGLRSFNRAMPEEINRVVSDQLSQWCFCPTQTAVRNLAREGVREGVHLIGDVMYDALVAFRGAAGHRRVSGGKGAYALATIHRAENTDDPQRLRGIVRALGRLGMRVVWPMHPRTRARLAALGVTVGESVEVIEPVSYLEMLALEERAALILTDSGGVQKEAAWLGAPCLTLRTETEWVETVRAGANRVVAPGEQTIVAAVRRLLNAPRPKPLIDAIGRGRAAERIVDVLLRELL